MSDDSVDLIVVDDLQDAATTLALMLELDGYRVRIAHSGGEALMLIEAGPPHCLLFDIDMPGIDGLELARRVRAQHGDDIVLIAVTARQKEDPRVAAAFRVADHHFIKPLEHQQLRKLLRPLGSSGAPTP